MRNIFNRVAKRNEDTTTELLVNLMHVSYIRDLILHHLGISTPINHNDISTQVSLNDVGRPDIVINNNDTLILIESKIRNDTDLQPTQTYSYVNKIFNSSHVVKHLIFLVPENYIHMQQLNETKSAYEFCSITTWESLLTFLYSKEIHLWNSVASQALEHISNVVLKKSPSNTLNREELVLMLSPKELNSANSLFIKLKEYVGNLSVQLITELGSDFNHSDWSWLDNDYELGKYIRYKNRKYIFVGFNFSLTKDNPELSDFLFCVDLYKDIVDLNKLKKSPYEYHFDGDWYYFKLNKFNYTAIEDVEPTTNEIISIIREHV